MNPDLFAAAPRPPLAELLRPSTLDEVIGQSHLLGPGKPLRLAFESGRPHSMILWGPPGVGKTTLARLTARAFGCEFIALSAVFSGVKDIRAAMEQAEQHLARGERTLLFVDEIHRFNKAQQDALLPAVEEGLVTLIGATTENPYFEVNAPLLSRSTLFRLEPLTVADLEVLLGRAVERERRAAAPEALTLIADRAGGDARAALTALEVALALAEGTDTGTGTGTVTLEDAERALSTRAMRYGRDEHYDVISAFIKSIRGSDPDGGLYWLARMLAAGEDARFIARRLVVLASEDVGMADPMALVVADAAARAVEFVGLPEASLNLAQAVIHLATAPKSNRTAVALWQAQADVRDLPLGEVPNHLRDSHYPGAAGLGHGVGYVYPHDDPRGWVPQQYRPDTVTGRRYFTPSHHGAEAALAEAAPAAAQGAAPVTAATDPVGTLLEPPRTAPPRKGEPRG